jgi:hypothetical protein
MLKVLLSILLMVIRSEEASETWEVAITSGTLILPRLCCHLVPEEQFNLFTSRGHRLFIPHKVNHFMPELGMSFWDECQLVLYCCMTTHLDIRK